MFLRRPTSSFAHTRSFAHVVPTRLAASLAQIHSTVLRLTASRTWPLPFLCAVLLPSFCAFRRCLYARVLVLHSACLCMCPGAIARASLVGFHRAIHLSRGRSIVALCFWPLFRFCSLSVGVQFNVLSVCCFVLFYCCCSILWLSFASHMHVETHGN